MTEGEQRKDKVSAMPEDGDSESAPQPESALPRIHVRSAKTVTLPPSAEGAAEPGEPVPAPEAAPAAAPKKREFTTRIYALRVTANREDQVMSFVTSNAARKKIKVYSVIRPHGMRGYIFVEAENREEAEQAAYGIPYARGILPSEIPFKDIEHMLERVKKDVNIQKNDIVEIISGPFKREKAKVTRVDKAKDEVVVELLEAAVPIPITLTLANVKVIRREEAEEK